MSQILETGIKYEGGEYEPRYYKVVNANFGTPGIHEYSIGTNIYEYKKNESLHNRDGLYFTDINNIFNYCNYGPVVLQITIPHDAKIIYYPEVIDSEPIPGWCADKINVEKYYFLTSTIDVIELLNNGADISAGNFEIIRWSLMNNHELFKFFSYFYGDIVKRVIEDYYRIYY